MICGKLEPDPDDALSATNPVVLLEVSSSSTADYDRNDKLLDYQRIPSVRYVVQVAHDAEQIDVWTLGDGGCSKATSRTGERAELSALECSLDVSDVYRDPLK